jgi:hypothetical protein
MLVVSRLVLFLPYASQMGGTIQTPPTNLYCHVYLYWWFVAGLWLQAGYRVGLSGDAGSRLVLFLPYASQMGGTMYIRVFHILPRI